MTLEVVHDKNRFIFGVIHHKMNFGGLITLSIALKRITFSCRRLVYLSFNK